PRQAGPVAGDTECAAVRRAAVGCGGDAAGRRCSPRSGERGGGTPDSRGACGRALPQERRMTGEVGAFLEATVRTATPLAIAALGETVSERAGVINLGLEGAMIAGAF